ncbi:hypothetical protein Tco_0756656, partial [Tanacetum coccineum]
EVIFLIRHDPTKVRIGERQRAKGEPKLLDTTVERVVSLLPVAPDRTEGADIQLVSEDVDTVVEDVALLYPMGQKKRKTVVVDAGEPSHPAKKLRENHGTPSGSFVARKSMSAVQRLLAEAVLNVEFRGEPIPTLPFVTSFVSTTPECGGGDHTKSVAGIMIVGPPKRSAAPVMTTVTTVTATIDAVMIPKEAPVKPSVFAAGSSSAGRTDPT